MICIVDLVFSRAGAGYPARPRSPNTVQSVVGRHSTRRMAKLISYLGFQVLATTVSTMFDGVAKVGSSVDGRRLKITY